MLYFLEELKIRAEVIVYIQMYVIDLVPEIHVRRRRPANNLRPLASALNGNDISEKELDSSVTYNLTTLMHSAHTINHFKKSA
jgi:hypothetical protein